MTMTEVGRRGNAWLGHSIGIMARPVLQATADSGWVPAISLLTTACRAEGSLAETVESVLAQAPSDWELIVADNGTFDEVVKMTVSYPSDPRVRLIRKENEGYANGAVAAAAVALGRCFAVLNSDDLLAPHCCERLSALLDAHPQIDAVGPDSSVFVDGGQRRFGSHFQSFRYWRRPRPENRLPLADALSAYQPSDGETIGRAAWFAIGGYAPAVPKVEDLSTYFRLIQAVSPGQLSKRCTLDSRRSRRSVRD